MKNFTKYIFEAERISLINDYIKESAEDGKNGHYEDFVDEDTGEIVTLWVADPDPEEEAQKAELAKAEHDKYLKCVEAEKKLRKTLDPLEDKLLGLNQDLKDKTREYRDLQIDQEEEVGALYVKGDESKAEELAQEYGEKFNKLADEINIIKNKIRELNPKVEKLQRELLKIWDD